jgi:hypothetical protein
MLCREGEVVTEREKLKREIGELERVIQSNASVLASKTMYDRDRESLRRQMTVRMAHQKLLQRRLDRMAASTSAM